MRSARTPDKGAGRRPTRSGVLGRGREPGDEQGAANRAGREGIAAAGRGSDRHPSRADDDVLAITLRPSRSGHHALAIEAAFGAAARYARNNGRLVMRKVMVAGAALFLFGTSAALAQATAGGAGGGVSGGGGMSGGSGAGMGGASGAGMSSGATGTSGGSAMGGGSGMGQSANGAGTGMTGQGGGTGSSGTGTNTGAGAASGGQTGTAGGANGGN